MMSLPTAFLVIQLEDLSGGDLAVLEQETIALRRHLIQFDDVIAVNMLDSDDPPAGAKAADMFAVGGLIVSVLASATHLKTVIGAARAALSSSRSVTLVMEGDSLTVTGVDSQEQQRLIDLWLQRHIQEGKIWATNEMP